MAEDTGYHIWELSKDFHIWRMLDRLPRRVPGDDVPFLTPGHFIGRSGASEYIRRNLKGRTVMVRQCTWPNCGFQHLEEFLAAMPADEVAMVNARRTAEAKAQRQRRADKQRKRKADFEEAVATEVARRLTALGVAV